MVGWVLIHEDDIPRGQDILVASEKIAGGFQTVVSWEENTNNPDFVWKTNESLTYHRKTFTHWKQLGPGPGD